MASREDCINAAVRAGATNEEAAAIVNDLLAARDKARAEGNFAGVEKKIAESIMNGAEAARMQNLMRRKQAALTIAKRASVDDFIGAVRAEGGNLRDALEALMVGSSKRFAGSRHSASARRAGIRNMWLGGLIKELDEIGAVKMLEKERGFSDKVRLEMLEPGASGDKLAGDVANIFTRYLEEARVRLNDAGAGIGKLENYAPQSHDEYRLLKAGETAWVDYVHAILNLERTFGKVTEVAEQRVMLGEIYNNIVTGQNRKASAREMGATFAPPRNLASGLAKERVLHFKDAAAASAYHEKFGRGTIIHAVLGQLEKASGRLALMEVFGPNPEAMLRSIIDGEARAARVKTVDEIRALANAGELKKLISLERRLEEARADGDAERERQIVSQWESVITGVRAREIKNTRELWEGHRDGKVAHYYAALAGETGTPVNLTGARISSGARAVMSMAKLGGASLSALADVFVKAVNLRFNGENFLDSWKHAFDMRIESLQSHEKVQLGRQLGVYFQGRIMDMHSRFDVSEGQSGAMTRAMNQFFRLSGLDAWTEGHKAAYTFHLSNRLADAAKGGFDAVQKDLRSTLKRHGLDKRWDLVQKMVGTEADGNAHVLPERAYSLSEADLEPHLPEHYREGGAPADPEKAEAWEMGRARAQERLRRELSTDIMGYYADETRFAILEPEEKTRALMYADTRPGTVSGEFRRFALQFKSFPVAYGQRFLSEMRWQKAGMEKEIGNDIPGFIHAAVGSMVFGYLAMSAKDLAKGREPRSPDKLETWIAAALQGGGLGIMGDFFLGNHDRFGNQAAANLLGPVPTMLSQVLPITGQLARGEMGSAAEDALRMAINNMPYINLWYTRAAMDYMFLFHMRESMSPGTLARSERKMKEEYNQTYLKLGGLDLTPSKVIKRGGFGFR